MIIVGEIDEIQRYSTHPVHILNESDNLNPSAFIPFCAFDGDMTVLSQMRENLSFPLCSAFQPRVLDGQVCYFVDLNTAMGDRTVRQGPAHGLTLFVDYNEERMVGRVTNEQEEAFPNLKEQTEDKELKIHINTLEPFIGYGSGNYEMSSIKMMETTAGFLALSEDVRGCQNRYSTLECQLEKYREEAESCGCQPFSLLGLFENVTVSSQL